MPRAKNPLEFDKETIKRIYRDLGLCYECGRRLEKCDCENLDKFYADQHPVECDCKPDETCRHAEAEELTQDAEMYF